ncbi:MULTISPECIES: hypothetical protein [unclassified Gilliamella]|uniref:hypothetical protein n=2 Tax=Gilliamella TaxID=1193503 RepID=UPI00080DE329|nr:MULTISPECIES: hypothetical protein [Gilliamella]NUE96926.1 hypothetical protein [Gilliamella sp. ESL0232]OCG36037.1 hypothetical protein A9G32_06030 [Gilliamella apicola]OCG47949.1 hypothetical protein A9G26_10995 [Gilliamella apicola]
MSFVNAYVSEEDAKKYDLDNLWNKYRRFGTKMPELLKSFDVHQHAWCVDKERGYWLFNCNYVLNYDTPSGLPEATHKQVFILHVNGQNIELILEATPWKPSDLQAIGLEYVNSFPIKIAWEIVSMNPSCLPSMSKADLLTILKEALTVYKFSGLRDVESNEEALIRCNF